MVILMFTAIIPTTNTNNSRQSLNKVYTWISMRLKYSYHLGIYLLLYIIIYNVSISIDFLLTFLFCRNVMDGPTMLAFLFYSYLHRQECYLYW